MLPNHFVIIWNGSPVGINLHGRPVKTEDPSRIAFFTKRRDVRDYWAACIQADPLQYRVMEIKEIQFKVVE